MKNLISFFIRILASILLPLITVITAQVTSSSENRQAQMARGMKMDVTDYRKLKPSNKPCPFETDSGSGQCSESDIEEHKRQVKRKKRPKMERN